MKRFVFLSLLGFVILSMVATGCGSKKKNDSIAVLLANRDSLRRAEEAAQAQAAEQRLQEEDLQPIEAPKVTQSVARRYSGYYVVLGCFRSNSNAKSFLKAMNEVFTDDKTELIARGSWSMVVLGGFQSSYAEAKRILRYSSDALRDYDYENLAFPSDEEEGEEEGYDEEYEEGYDEEYEEGYEEGYEEDGYGGGFAQEDDEEYMD